MPRYIDANVLDLYDELFMKGKNDSGVWVRYKDVERLIRNAPTADVEEVKHGEWIVEDAGGGWEKGYMFAMRQDIFVCKRATANTRDAEMPELRSKDGRRCGT